VERQRERDELLARLIAGDTVDFGENERQTGDEAQANAGDEGESELEGVVAAQGSKAVEAAARPRPRRVAAKNTRTLESEGEESVEVVEDKGKGKEKEGAVVVHLRKVDFVPENRAYVSIGPSTIPRPTGKGKVRLGTS
jgi:hypothetical protein